MNKIFCITCHQVTSPLKLTVEYLSSFKDNHIIMHVDNNSNLDDFIFLESENVTLLNQRVNVSWGSSSQIKSTILLLRKSLEIDFDYLFFISGDDLPCATNETINKFLQDIKLANMVHYQDSRNSFVNPIDRVKYKHPSFFFNKEKSIKTKIKKTLFKLAKPFFINKLYKKAVDHGIVFYKGTNWFSLNKETVSDSIEFLDKNKWFIDLFEHSICGDEVFFHSLFKHIGVSDFYHDISKKNDALRYIDWESGPEYPKLLNDDDIDKIKKSQCIFARKFEKNVDNNILNKLID